MKKIILYTLSISMLCTDTFFMRMNAESCEDSNILLQPGGVYSLWFKSCGCEPDLYENSMRKRFQTQLLVYGCEADKGFNNNHDQVPLESVVFGKDIISMQDIFLASKLGYEDKFFLPGAMPIFGADKDEQYIALLAPTKIKIQTEAREIGANLSGIYTFCIPCAEYAVGAIGLEIPIRHQVHTMNLGFKGGSLFGAETIPVGGMFEENTLKHFFRDFQSIEDFFCRGVLQEKDLEFLKKQYKTGIGDVSALGLVDFGLYFEHTEALQIGLNIVFPSGNKQSGKKIWEVELGNGGAYQFEPFINVYLCGNRFVNPMVYASIRLSRHFTGMRRIAQKSINNNNNADIADLSIFTPDRFAKHKVTSFNEVDSSVLYFADHAVCTTISPGAEYIARIGNYIYDFLVCNFYFGLFYDLRVKRKDSFQIRSANQFDVSLLEGVSERTMHKFTWNIAYAAENKVEVYIGSQHVVAGKNVPQYHKIFASASLFF